MSNLRDELDNRLSVFPSQMSVSPLFKDVDRGNEVATSSTADAAESLVQYEISRFGNRFAEEFVRRPSSPSVEPRPKYSQRVRTVPQSVACRRTRPASETLASQEGRPYPSCLATISTVLFAPLTLMYIGSDRKETHASNLCPLFHVIVGSQVPVFAYTTS